MALTRKSSTQGTKQSKSPWLFGPWVDLFVGGGLWSLPLIGLTIFLSMQGGIELAFGFYLLALFCNNPHYMATVYRAYGNGQQVHKYRIFTVYITALILLIAITLHFVPRWLPWVFTLYLFWSPWHYTGQNYGILMMLAGRHGERPTGLLRQLIYSCFVLSFLIWLLAVNGQSSEDYRVMTLALNGPWLKPLLLTASMAYVLLACTAFSMMRRRLGVKIALSGGTLLFTQFIWFIAPITLTLLGTYTTRGTFYSAGILALMHCAQYLWVTTYYAKNEALTQKVTWRPWRYYGILVLGGIILFTPGPWIASRFFHYDLFFSLSIFMALVNLHHFILDGAIWKLRDGAVARLLLISPAEKETENSSSHSPLKPPTISGSRRVLFGLAILLIAGLATADVLQYWLTERDASPRKLEWAKRLNPNDSRIYFRLGLLSVQSQKNEEAEDYFKQAIKINPYNAPAQHHLGQLLMQAGESEIVYTHYNSMASLFRPDLAININGGLAALGSGRPIEAATLFEDALQLDAQRIELHRFLGQAFLEANRPEDAQLHLYYYLNEAFFNEEDSLRSILLWEKEKLLKLYTTLELLIRSERALGQIETAQKWDDWLSEIARQFD